MTSRSATSTRPAARGRLAVVAAIAIAAAACSSIPTPEVQQPEGRQFIQMVPDSIDDVGLAPSVAIDGEGLPTISYFGFTASLEEGEIPQARPVGSPFLQTEDGEDAGAVLLASLSPSQIWNRGAVAQPRETPAGLTIPFGPATDPSLASLTPPRAKGTDLEIAGTDIHAAWAVDTGVWYGAGPDFEIGPVEETPEAGAPSIVVDGAGAPLVAYTTAGAPPEVRVAERVDDRWEITSVATLSSCGEGCPPATSMALVGDAPHVVVADPGSGDLIAARREGGSWTTEVVSSDATGGAALAASGDTAVISFATESGVSIATGSFGSWVVEEVAPASGVVSTAVAVDGEGTTSVAWEDGEGVHLAPAADDGFQEVEASGTEGGVWPSLAVTEDGTSVFLAWYDPESGDLRLGAYTEVQDLLVAAQSPPPEVAAAPPAEGCGEDGRPILEIVAQGTAFDTNCLVAPAAEPFTITFDNQDQGLPHNVAIYTDSSAADSLFVGETFPGVAEREYEVEPQDAGDYFFRCDVHPDQMTGTFVVVEGGGGGNGGGGGGGG
ncbi:MAG TPA: cupredoxin domain-containing protein [Actinomycetota bacterium]|nr:cupredoxin domain-containing protein [Actinomycetota bacterium]